MKRLLYLVLFLAFCIIPTTNSCIADDITDDIADELLETSQQDEIVLNLEDSEKLAYSSIVPSAVAIQHEYSKELPKEKFKKKLFKLSSTLIDNEDNDNDVMDNAELDFEIFRIFDENKEISEDTLVGKIVHSKIRRTDVPSYLLKDDLTFEYENGPISKIQAFGTYRGSLSSIWASNDYSTEYDTNAMQLGVYGSFRKPNNKFKISTNPIPKRGQNYLDGFISDFYYLNTSVPNHQIIVGRSRVMTGFEGGTSPYTLPFVARSQIARNFGNARSLSAKIIGNYQYIDYNLSVGSSGRYITSGVPGTEFNGWVNVKPFGNKRNKYGKLTIGGGFNGGHNQIDYSVASGYIGYHHKKLWTNFETAIADGYNGSRGVSANKACGWAATVGWKLNPHLQLIGRIDQFDPDRNVSNNLQREYTIGVNWFIRGQALKVMLNYVFCDSQNRPDSHKVILATQIIL